MQPASGARRPGNDLADTVVSVRTPGALKNVGWNACAAPQHRTAQDSAISNMRIFFAASSLGQEKNLSVSRVMMASVTPSLALES